MTYFKKLTLHRWRQFENVEIDFDSNLTVLTGKNGCGKTTILNVLGRHFGWNISFVSTPYISKKKKKKFWADVWDTIESDFEIPPNAKKVGDIKYNSEQSCNLLVPNNTNQPNYNLQYHNQQPVKGITIPSHRPVATYHTIQNIPINPRTNQQQFEEFQQLLIQTYGSGNVRNPGIVLKQSLISLGVFGFGNQNVAPNQEYIDLFEGFQGVLRKILPPEIGFQKLEIRMPDIVLITNQGPFNIDAMSGGINALFSIAWQIHMYGANNDMCTVLIDEPENHLHPSMQRDFLPSLKQAFPNYRFIVATHSPFILSSLPDASVYALTFNEKNNITSTLLKESDLTGSANKILKDILDVPVTLPRWVESKVKGILSEYLEGDYDEEKAKAAFNALKEAGLNDALKDINL